VANFFTQREPLAGIAKKLSHIAPQRRITPFAERSFSAWFARRPAQKGVQPAAQTATKPERVILWPDTFNNYFHPEVAQAALRVLQHAGCEVALPSAPVCCGRPLYEFGMLDRARDYLKRVMAVLADDIHAGTPIIGLEPACVSVFREELPNLFPFSEQAKRLRGQVVLLSEYLDRKAGAFPFPPLAREAVVHGHCHHKAVLKMDAEESVMKKMGLDYRLLDSGCCGMAGSFGFERDKYEVSMRCAERVLLPAVRDAKADALVIADGFSCREQILQATGTQALHLAQALQMALDGA
jgi:Fe-S oxidoreductase